MFEEIGNDTHQADFLIPGLRFEKNSVSNTYAGNGWFSRKLMSSKGPLISDFVTHEPDFSYSTYGIHVGQDDRLTFMGDNGKKIEGFFVDCREGSPSIHHIVQLRFSPSLYRHLVIPRGVAHTFDNLEYIVTRDEPIWHSDQDNTAWNLDNDLVSVPRTTELAKFPIIKANRYRLPDEAHRFLSKISQSLLENPKSYLARYPVTIRGAEQYVMFEPKTWSDDARSVAERLTDEEFCGVRIKRNRYALTGAKSYTLVPNTASCVADVLVLPTSVPGSPQQYYWHARTRKTYTFLNNQELQIDLNLIDLRHDSATYGQHKSLQIICDPRTSIHIEQGIAYTFNCSKPTLVRCEHEVFVSQNEPRSDIPMFGQDLIPFTVDQPYPNIKLPDMRCPDILLYKMAKFEQQTLERT
ncbi:dTDP-4-dehydrorhamnose 3,5-epimerase family protein [Pseudomonas chlororaphis]|uniref:dTDP-4-dehydrorhamnose 3,5-epimerase family protein n=1 Tax=Pseudomonas TaxID=286 RepID=UPI000C88C9E1|nr:MULTISPECIES: dTDP-4-dehydrorhamnose 3,5-epimerase family protein [Pseudomonas]MBP5088827.1 dTDP-4-dehydrorhamnose 3,5-epimerase family protein [Pseudomonas chlororaphis]PMY38706.1 dTDP-4-dehydrorhamnose 3,5-epimerase [Pseudomonas sp. FW306-2-2C-D06C]PYC30401.1 dTDP-4-dehydrorhamnose 3,5-epimerase [Pseudomonas chlororaphis]WMJ01312.1 dTDP-4-dehydrorhamnose 3,5-epimerase [Pseudomonas chlororaphis subsp. aurantiaca]